MERMVLSNLSLLSPFGARLLVSIPQRHLPLLALLVTHRYFLFSIVEDLPTGYQGSRAVRCTDRFVRYPYPKTLFSNYRQNYYGKLTQTEVKNHKQAFNLEKETKIINPHRMELDTTNKTKYKGEKGERAAPKK